MEVSRKKCVRNPKRGKKAEGDQKSAGGEGQCESGDKPRVQSGRKGDHPEARSCGVWRVVRVWGTEPG